MQHATFNMQVQWVARPTRQLLNMFAGYCPCSGPTPFYAMAALSSTTLAVGHYWKLVSALFLHNGVGHVMINMKVLHVYGAKLEKTVGTSKFLLIYGLAGLASSVLSAHFLVPGVIGLGASGAVYGIAMASHLNTASAEGDTSLGWLFCTSCCAPRCPCPW